MSVCVMVNEKFRERVQPWDVSFDLRTKLKFKRSIFIGNHRTSGAFRSIFVSCDAFVFGKQ